MKTLPKRPTRAASRVAESTFESLLADKAPPAPSAAQPITHFVAYRGLGLPANAPLIAVYSTAPFASPLADSDAAAASSSYIGEQLSVASLMSAERVAAYKDLEDKEGAAVMAQLLALSSPASHWFAAPVHGFGNSVVAAIDHLRARAVYVAQGDRRLRELLASDAIEEV
ncbi:MULTISPECIES: hypothetical protein [unclassified Caballeronia]|uniref:hypothetical protein n=1 Tax=unclassified Caballeronia TaxID=2646786 RepID=UPI002856D38B|nr:MULTISPECIES: hypothetical protein [unclassified Caballeronia]MDR5750358.1 hypothetical protein [Caballeronia sp. LZ024]MDR5842610.1 hypothetical protein [Caballeronia sp. LZ031]